MITLGDRAADALKAATLQALRNSNMGQIDGYRLNHVIILVERIQAEERERCARIADKYAANAKEERRAAEAIAARIRDGRDPVAVAPAPDLAGAAPVAEADPYG